MPPATQPGLPEEDVSGSEQGQAVNRLVGMTEKLLKHMSSNMTKLMSSDAFLELFITWLSLGVALHGAIAHRQRHFSLVSLAHHVAIS